MTTPGNSVEDEASIRKLLEQWERALVARDLDGMLALYAPDVVFFDAVPPYQRKGAAEYRAAWENMMPHLPPDLAVETREAGLVVSGEAAFAHCLTLLSNAKTGEPATCGWVRVTICFQRRQGQWRVVHEHVSVPFDPVTSQAACLRELK
jgi:uncharacterized protein (TIGR02246 family)